MIVLSHRGYWQTAAEKNTAAAFQRSFDLGFGTETDVRDAGGELVISHDPPTGGEMPFSAFLDILGDRDLPLALNVKSDGLAGRIHAAMSGRALTQWFVFDMSIPDTIQQLKHKNPVFARVSDYEPVLPERLVARLAGVWLDGFDSDWWTSADVAELARTRPVCIVSPELHGRDPLPAWTALRNHPVSLPNRIWLCTDRPEDARTWFGGQP